MQGPPFSGNLARRGYFAAPALAGDVLKRAFRRYGIDRHLARYQFVLHWREIVGEEIAKRAVPECIRKGALIVRVVDSTWAQELSFQKQVILKRLRKFVRQDEAVEDIVFYVSGRKA